MCDGVKCVAGKGWRGWSPMVSSQRHCRHSSRRSAYPLRANSRPDGQRLRIFRRRVVVIRSVLPKLTTYPAPEPTASCVL